MKSDEQIAYEFGEKVGLAMRQMDGARAKAELLHFREWVRSKPNEEDLKESYQEGYERMNRREVEHFD